MIRVIADWTSKSVGQNFPVRSGQVFSAAPAAYHQHSTKDGKPFFFSPILLPLARYLRQRRIPLHTSHDPCTRIPNHSPPVSGTNSTGLLARRRHFCLASRAKLACKLSHPSSTRRSYLARRTYASYAGVTASIREPCVDMVEPVTTHGTRDLESWTGQA